MPELLSPVDLPRNFEYPALFVRVAECGLRDLEPWLVLEGDLLRLTAQALTSRCKRRTLVPFARRQDNDDVACWEPTISSTAVTILDPYESPPLEVARFPSFEAWFRQAIEDFITFE